MKLIFIFLTTLFCLTANAQTNSAVASWYYPRHNAQLVCASYDYPIGSRLVVTEIHNRLSVTVTVIERGPNRRLHRQVDLSPDAFLVLAGLELGLAEVIVKRIK